MHVHQLALMLLFPRVLLTVLAQYTMDLVLIFWQ